MQRRRSSGINILKPKITLSKKKKGGFIDARTESKFKLRRSQNINQKKSLRIFFSQKKKI